jgi:hypothetical protein
MKGVSALPRLGAGPAPLLRMRGGTAATSLTAVSESGALTAAGVPALTSAALLFLLAVLARRPPATAAARRAPAGARLRGTLFAAASAALLFASMTLRDDPVAALGALGLAAGAALGATDGAGADPTLRHASIAAAALSLIGAVGVPGLLAALLDAGKDTARRAAAAAATSAAGQLKGRAAMAARSSAPLAAAAAATRSEGLMCTFRAVSQVLAAAGAGATLPSAAELPAGGASRLASLLPPMAAALALARSPAHLALPLWCLAGSATSLGLASAGEAAAQPSPRWGVRGALAAVLAGALAALSALALLPRTDLASWLLVGSYGRARCSAGSAAAVTRRGARPCSPWLVSSPPSRPPGPSEAARPPRTRRWRTPRTRAARAVPTRARSPPCSWR